MRTSDPAFCVAAAKQARFARNNKLRIPHTKVEKEAARQERLNKHLEDFLSFRSSEDFVEDPENLSVKRI